MRQKQAKTLKSRPRSHCCDCDDGAPSIVVIYTWTNNSDETTSFAIAAYPYTHS